MLNYINFRKFNESINIDYKKSGKSYTINAKEGSKNLGILSMEYINNPESGAYWFDGLISDEIYDDITDGKPYVFIKNIKVLPTNQKSGIGTLLLKKSIEISKELKTNLIMLNASNIGKEIPMDKLIMWYKKNGFNLIKKTGNNMVMSMRF